MVSFEAPGPIPHRGHVHTAEDGDFISSSFRRLSFNVMGCGTTLGVLEEEEDEEEGANQREKNLSSIRNARQRRITLAAIRDEDEEEEMAERTNGGAASAGWC